MKAKDVRNAALALSEEERATLANALLESLGPAGEPVSDEEWASAWGAEISRRLERYEATGETVTHAEVMAEARRRLDAMRR